MSTFLELAQDVKQESGLSGTGPLAVTGLSGMDKKVVDWTNDAWFDIQSSRQNWRWMWRDDGTVTTVASQRAYDISSFTPQTLVQDSFVLNYGGSKTPLVFLTYEDFRLRVNALPDVTGMPTVVTQDPTGALRFDAIPDQAYTVTFEYYIAPSYLIAAEDEPALPNKFHRMIVERALMKYCNHDEALPMYQDARAEFNKWMRRMENEQMPQVLTGETLA